MQPFGRDIDEVHIFGHDLCELVTIVLRPGRRKRLRNIMDRCFIGLVLGMNGAPGDKKNHEQVAQYLLHYFASPKMLLTSSPRGIAVPDQARSSYCLGAVLTLSLRIFARAPLMNVYLGWAMRDWIRAWMVGSGASTVGSWPRSRRVWLVIGPMEARTMLGGRVRLAASRRAKRLRAVEALVKVMARGWFVGGRKGDRGGGRVRLAACRRAKRLRAVEALVKVMASG